jgi:hypothetical protein
METYWGRCSFNGPLPPWELRNIPGKGYAAFALQRFAKGSLHMLQVMIQHFFIITVVQGEIILREYPTVWIHGHHPFNESNIKEIEKRIGDLSLEENQAFYNMANVFPESECVAAGIFMTNRLGFISIVGFNI